MTILKKIKYNSPVVLSFVIASLIALGLNYITGGYANQWFFSAYKSSMLNPLTYVRMLGHVIGHADLEHYVNNMVYILLLGPLMEEKYGSKNLLEMIGITAVITAVINMAFFDTALLGASGIAFMLIILSSITGIREGEIPLTLIIVVVFFLGKEVVNGLFVQDNISQLTHIVGGVCGGVFGKVLQSDKSS